MSNASDLSTHMQSIPPLQRRLIAMTNFNTDSPTSVNTSVLEDYCDEAIDWFQLEFGDYDATNYPSHKTLARYRVMQLMAADAEDLDMFEQYEQKMLPIMEGLRRKRRAPVSGNSPFTPTDPTDGGTIEVKPDFDDTKFESYGAG